MFVTARARQEVFAGLPIRILIQTLSRRFSVCCSKSPRCIGVV